MLQNLKTITLHYFQKVLFLFILSLSFFWTYLRTLTTKNNKQQNQYQIEDQKALILTERRKNEEIQPPMIEQNDFQPPELDAQKSNLALEEKRESENSLDFGRYHKEVDSEGQVVQNDRRSEEDVEPDQHQKQKMALEEQDIDLNRESFQLRFEHKQNSQRPIKIVFSFDSGVLKNNLYNKPFQSLNNIPLKDIHYRPVNSKSHKQLEIKTPQGNVFIISGRQEELDRFAEGLKKNGSSISVSTNDRSQILEDNDEIFGNCCEISEKQDLNSSCRSELNILLQNLKQPDYSKDEQSSMQLLLQQGVYTFQSDSDNNDFDQQEIEHHLTIVFNLSDFIDVQNLDSKEKFIDKLDLQIKLTEKYCPKILEQNKEEKKQKNQQCFNMFRQMPQRSQKVELTSKILYHPQILRNQRFYQSIEEDQYQHSEEVLKEFSSLGYQDRKREKIHSCNDSIVNKSCHLLEEVEILGCSLDSYSHREQDPSQSQVEGVDSYLSFYSLLNQREKKKSDHSLDLRQGREEELSPVGSFVGDRFDETEQDSFDEYRQFLEQDVLYINQQYSIRDNPQELDKTVRINSRVSISQDQDVTVRTVRAQVLQSREYQQSQIKLQLNEQSMQGDRINQEIIELDRERYGDV